MLYSSEETICLSKPCRTVQSPSPLLLPSSLPPCVWSSGWDPRSLLARCIEGLPEPASMGAFCGALGAPFSGPMVGLWSTDDGTSVTCRGCEAVCGRDWRCRDSSDCSSESSGLSVAGCGARGVEADGAISDGRQDSHRASRKAARRGLMLYQRRHGHTCRRYWLPCVDSGAKAWKGCDCSGGELHEAWAGASDATVKPVSLLPR